MKVIIIEDESRAARDLKRMMEEINQNIEVIAILSSVSRATKWLLENDPPDLIFADIELGDGLSFKIFQNTNTSVPVVFCTAFNEYAIEAFQCNSIEYILKPIEEEALQKSFDKFFNFSRHFKDAVLSYEQRLNIALSGLEKNYKKSLLIHYRGSIIPVKIEDINFVFSSEGVVTLFTKSQSAYQLPHTIDNLEQILNPQVFFRANRQFLVNRDMINNVELYFNRRLVIKPPFTSIPKMPDKIIISKLKAKDFLHWFEN